MKNVVVEARVGKELRQEASEVLAEMGLTVSDVMRMTLKRVARDRKLPFDPAQEAESVDARRRGANLPGARKP